jgi:hypothetical protein
MVVRMIFCRYLDDVQSTRDMATDLTVAMCVIFASCVAIRYYLLMLYNILNAWMLAGVCRHVPLP